MMKLVGTFTANGTILGVPTSQSGRWSGRIRITMQPNYQYILTSDFVDLRVNIPTGGGASWSSSGFSSDLFHPMHPLKKPFDTLVQTQLTAQFTNTWRRDLYPYMADFFNEKLGIATFHQLIKSQLPATTPSIPLSTTPVPAITTTTPSPFQCEAGNKLNIPTL